MVVAILLGRIQETGGGNTILAVEAIAVVVVAKAIAVVVVVVVG